MNKIIIIGRLTQEPNISMTKSNKKVAKYVVAVDDGYGDNKTTDFINCASWEKGAEIIEKYCHKGTKVAVSGKLKVTNYEKDGEKKTYSYILADNCEFMESKKPEEKKPEVEEDDELPFD